MSDEQKKDSRSGEEFDFVCPQGDPFTAYVRAATCPYCGQAGQFVGGSADFLESPAPSSVSDGEERETVMVSRSTELTECHHGIERNGKVICDCFVSALIEVLENEGFDAANEIATIVHDVDNALAGQRVASPPPSEQTAQGTEAEAFRNWWRRPRSDDERLREQSFVSACYAQNPVGERDGLFAAAAVVWYAATHARDAETQQLRDQLGEFWREQAEWSNATFGNEVVRGPLGPLRHLEKEVAEAIAAIGTESFLEEMGDALAILLDAARRGGLTLDDLVAQMFRKIAVNKTRKWPATHLGGEAGIAIARDCETITNGYDGDDILFADELPLTLEERREIAEEMILRWAKFGGMSYQVYLPKEPRT